MSVEQHLYVILSVLVHPCPLIKSFQTFNMEAVARPWNKLLLLRGCPAVGVIRRNLPRAQSELEKVCCVKNIFFK